MIYNNKLTKLILYGLIFVALVLMPDIIVLSKNQIENQNIKVTNYKWEFQREMLNEWLNYLILILMQLQIS